MVALSGPVSCLSLQTCHRKQNDGFVRTNVSSLSLQTRHMNLNGGFVISIVFYISLQARDLNYNGGFVTSIVSSLSLQTRHLNQNGGFVSSTVSCLSFSKDVWYCLIYILQCWVSPKETLLVLHHVRQKVTGHHFLEAALCMT